MTGPKDPPLQRGSGRVLMVGGLVLAVVAAVVLALGAQDAGLLRLGIVAALWAALFGTFAAVRMRREISAGADRAEDMQTIYRMELDREIAARREHELTVERELREQIEQREREEITALRGELQSLRETLRHLMGGDVLVERVALRAESTRLLPMPEPAPAVADNHGRTSSGPTPAAPRSLGGAAPPARRTGADPRDVQHRDVQHRDVQHRGAPASPRSEPVEAPARPAAASRPRRDPAFRPAVGDPAFRPAVGDPGLRPAAGDAARPAAGDPAFRPAAGDAARPEPSIFASTAAELAGRSAPAPAARPWQPAVSAEQQSARRQRTVSPPQRPGSVPPEPSAAPVSPAPAATPPAATPAASGPGVGGGRHSGPQYSSYSSSTHGNGTGAHSNGNGTGAHGNGTGAHSNSNGTHSNGNGTHSNGNGTHSNSTGAHSNSNGAGPSGGGRRRAPEQTPAGTPAGGRPVGELLAAYGEGSAPRHRRRRAAD